MPLALKFLYTPMMGHTGLFPPGELTCANPRKKSWLLVRPRVGSICSAPFFFTQFWYACEERTAEFRHDTAPVRAATVEEV